jgi:similar to spore coat protein
MYGNTQQGAGSAILTDQVIATDFLLNAKAGVKNYATAITETSSPEVRNVLKRQLNDAINMHERIASYMINRGYYHVNNLQDQIKADLQMTSSVMSL